MRCKNCGWENPAGNRKCEKCHANLQSSNDSESAIPFKESTNIPRESEKLKSTVSEKVKDLILNNPESTLPSVSTCSECGYPLREACGVCPNCGCNTEVKAAFNNLKCKTCKKDIINSDWKFCPECGTQVVEKISANDNSSQRPLKGTINAKPWSFNIQAQKGCTLTPIAREGENIGFTPHSYSGECIVLTRDNTESGNNTITTRQQAILTNKDGQWYIENRSDLKTTYIRVNDKIRLNDGDIVVLGNREFEFRSC